MSVFPRSSFVDILLLRRLSRNSASSGCSFGSVHNLELSYCACFGWKPQWSSFLFAVRSHIFLQGLLMHSRTVSMSHSVVLSLRRIYIVPMFFSFLFWGSVLNFPWFPLVMPRTPPCMGICPSNFCVLPIPMTEIKCSQPFFRLLVHSCLLLMLLLWVGFLLVFSLTHKLRCCCRIYSNNENFPPLFPSCSRWCCDGLLEVSPPLDVTGSRSAMLSMG